MSAQKDKDAVAKRNAEAAAFFEELGIKVPAVTQPTAPSFPKGDTDESAHGYGYALRLTSTT